MRRTEMVGAAMSPLRSGALTPLMRVSAALLALQLALFVVRLAFYAPPVVWLWVLPPVQVVLTGFASLRVTRRGDLPRPVRRFFRHFAVCLVFIAGGLISGAHDSFAGQGPPTQVSSMRTLVLFLAGVGVLVWAVLRLPMPARSTGAWLTLYLDMAIVMAAGGAVGWHLAARGGPGLPAASLQSGFIAIVVLALILLLTFVKVAMGGIALLDQGALWAFGTTILVGAVGGGLAPLLAARQDLNDAMVVPSMACLTATLACELQRRAPKPSATTAPGAPRPGRKFLFLPYAAIGVTDAILLGPAAQDDGRFITATLIGLTALVVGRQMVAFSDNARLVRRLDESLLELSRHERRFRSLVQNASDIILITDRQTRVDYASPGLLRVLGMTEEAWLGRSMLDLVHPEDAAEVTARMTALLATDDGDLITLTARFRHADGSWRWLDIVSTNLLHDPSVSAVVSNARDVTDSRRASDQMAHQASHDALTGLANRALLQSLSTAALTGDGEPRRIALALVDLDDFKGVNDKLGHAVGDALLVAVSERLGSCVREADTVARLGGDEFAILLADLTPGESDTIAERLVAALALPVTADGHDLLTQASIGIAEADDLPPGMRGGDAAAELLRRADVAMYSAKEQGKSQYAHYAPALDARTAEHARIAADLHLAVERGEFHLLYQPIVTLPEGNIAGVEALVRWEHPTRGPVSPTEFIPVAERTGLIVPLGDWVLREACRQGAKWRRSSVDPAAGRVNVNVSARQLVEPGFAEQVVEALADSGLPADLLTIEITETAVFGGGLAVATVRALHDLGLQIALDDFGTGHSSLGLLQACPVDVLKVDKSFVDGVTDTPDKGAIAISIREIARALRLDAVAEGVETAAQAELLHRVGYRKAQGFHFAEPLPADEVTARLQAASENTRIP